VQEQGPAPSTGMQGIFADYQIDRKTSNIDQLRRTFALPQDAERISQFKCALEGKAGQLHVTTYHVCFLAAGAAKKVTAGYVELASVAKAKTRFKLFGGTGGGITLSFSDGRVLNFASCAQRDDAIASIKAAAAKQSVALDP